MNLRSGRAREEPEINFIPMIDVLLVILIFLMVTTTYQRVAELQITLPEATAEPIQQRPKEINVGVDVQGRYAIDKEVFQFTTVAAFVRCVRRAAGRCQGAGGRHQCRCERNPPIGNPRHGSGAAGGPDTHHFRNANTGQMIAPAPEAGVTRRRSWPYPTASSPRGMRRGSRR